MNSFTNRLAGVATLALAILPMAALTTAAHAAPAVHVADLNLATASGQSVLSHRVDAVARQLCGDERSLTLQGACKAGVRAEVAEKLSAQPQQIQYAARG